MSLGAIKAMARIYGPDWKSIWVLRNKNISLTMLPDEILEIIALKLLEVEKPSSIHFSQISKKVYTYLLGVRIAAKSKLLRWLPELSINRLYLLKKEGRALTTNYGHPHFRLKDCYEHAWAAGSLLPTVGRVSFRVRIDFSKYNDAIIGVCTAGNTHAWGLRPGTGYLKRRMFNSRGEVYLGSESAQPANYPDGEGTQIFKTRLKRGGRPIPITGKVIEVSLDHRKGSLSFKVNDSPMSLPLYGFPKGARIRPWVDLNRYGDSVSFKSAFF